MICDIWHPKSRQVLRVRDISFREDCLYKDDISQVDIPADIDEFSSMVGSSDGHIFQPHLNKWNLSQDFSKVKIRDSDETKTTKFSVLDGQWRADVYQEEDTNFKVPGNFTDPEPQIRKYVRALRENELSTDINPDNIIHGKRTRRTNPSAAVHIEPIEDFGVNCGNPFFPCLVNAITTDGLDGKVNRFNNYESCSDQTIREKASK